MSKNKLIILICIIIILLIVGCSKKKIEKNEIKNMNTEIESAYDEETGLYYIKDKETGTIIHATTDEIDLEFYKENPDYNPNPLANKSNELTDFLNFEKQSSEEIIEQENDLEKIQ